MVTAWVVLVSIWINVMMIMNENVDMTMMMMQKEPMVYLIDFFPLKTIL